MMSRRRHSVRIARTAQKGFFCESICLPTPPSQKKRMLVTPEQWREARQVFDEALQKDPQQRAVFLAQSCAGDEALRRKVEALLVAHQNAGSFLEQPVQLPEMAAATVHLSPGIGRAFLHDGAGHFRR